MPYTNCHKGLTPAYLVAFSTKGSAVSGRSALRFAVCRDLVVSGHRMVIDNININTTATDVFFRLSLHTGAAMLCHWPFHQPACINSDVQRAALATIPTADHIQTVPADVQGAPRSGSGLPGATLHSCFIRRGSSSSEVSLLRSTHRAANFQENFWRQGIRKLRTHLMELSVQFSERRLSVAPLFQETLENGPILTCCFCRAHCEYEILTQTSFSVALM